MPAINLPAPLNAIQAFATDKPLSDPALPSTPVALTLPAQSKTFDLADPTNPANKLGSFSVSADETTSVAIVNSTSDPDPMGYFNLGGSTAPAAENAGDAPTLDPPAEFDPTLAYVVVTGLSVSGKLSGNFTIGTPGSLALDGSGALDASACMAFPRNTSVWQAVGIALAQFKTLFSVNELTALTPAGSGLPTPWQVLSFGVQGSLNLSLKFTAASLAGQIADSVNAVLNWTGPFKFDTSASATVTVSYAASDGYRVFAQRSQPGTLAFAVKKSSSTSLGLNTAVGLKVSITEADLTALVNTVFEQANGVAAGTVQALLGTGAGGPLTTAQQQTLQSLLAKLGLTNVVGQETAALQAKLKTLHDDLMQRITPVVSAQFSYSWQRLTSDSLVAQFTVPDTAVAKYHPYILALNLNALLAGVGNDGIVFTKLLGQSVQELDVGYGFSFGLNGYTFLKSWDSLQTKFVELRTLAPGGGWLLRDTFLGKRAYASTWMDSSQSNYVELDAAMSAPDSAPSIGDFYPALSVAFSWKSSPFSRIVQLVADCGAVISGFDTDDVAAAQQALVAAGLDTTATGDALVSLTVNNAALRRLLPALTGDSYRTQIAPHAMARALPFYADYPERSRVERRMQVYGQVFADFLATTELAINTVAKLCQSDLPAVTDGGNVSSSLIDRETNAGMFAWTAQGVVSMADAGNLQDAVLTSVPACFSELAQSAGDFRNVFPDCVANFSELAAQSYGTRVLASMLVLAAMVTPGTLDLLSRTVQFTWTDGTTKRTVIMRQGNS